MFLFDLPLLCNNFPIMCKERWNAFWFKYIWFLYWWPSSIDYQSTRNWILLREFVCCPVFQLLRLGLILLHKMIIFFHFPPAALYYDYIIIKNNNWSQLCVQFNKVFPLPMLWISRNVKSVWLLYFQNDSHLHHFLKFFVEGLVRISKIK